MQPGRFNRDPRLSAITIVAGSALLVLVGCTSVADRLTGVSLSRAVPSSCLKQCSNLYRTLFDQEQKGHITLVEACRNLPEAEKGPCLEAEGTRHAAEMERLTHGLIDCQNSCP